MDVNIGIKHNFLCSVATSLDVNIHVNTRNYRVSKEVVHELEFGDIAVMQI